MGRAGADAERRDAALDAAELEAAEFEAAVATDRQAAAGEAGERVAADRQVADPEVADGGAAVADDEDGGAEAEPAGPPGLSQRDRDILVFERQWWRHAGAKEQAIRDTFDLSATRYYQVLNVLLDDPAALAFDPLVVGRLRRLRSRAPSGRPGSRRTWRAR